MPSDIFNTKEVTKKVVVDQNSKGVFLTKIRVLVRSAGSNGSRQGADTAPSDIINTREVTKMVMVDQKIKRVFLTKRSNEGGMVLRLVGF